MDPELMQLFMSAKGSNRNVSGLLGNLDNPMLAYLAGVYDPVSAQGKNAGGALWSQYSQNPDPTIQDIISKIEGGADEFYLNSYIDAMGDVSQTGFQVGDLKGLAKALQKEYTGASSGSSYGGKQDVWSKAGLRNPLDLYTAEDAPLSAKESAAYAQFLNKASESEKGMGDIEYRIRSLQAQAKSRAEGNDTYSDDMIGQAKTVLSTGGGLGEKAFKSGDMISQAKKILAGGGLGEGAFKSGDMIAQGKKTLDPSKGKPKTSGKKKATTMSRKQGDEISRALAQRHDLDTIIQGDLARADAIKQGGLARVQQAGRTPTRDQLAGIMKFLTGQSNG